PEHCLAQPRPLTSHCALRVRSADCVRGWLHDVDDREARVDIEAGGREERGAEVTGEERVTALAACGRNAVRLSEGVDSEAAGAFKPEFVAGACECLEERKAVARGAVAEAVAFLVFVCAGLPDEFRAGEDEIFVEIVPRSRKDTWSASAPLETDPTIARTRKLRARRARPVGETVLAGRVPCENGCGIACERFVLIESEQGKRVAGGTVKRAEASVIVILTPETVVAAPRAKANR